jgi:hypothetical protein
MTISAKRHTRGRESPAIMPGQVRVSYLNEPLLVFGGEGLHVDPKSGISRYGPRSLGTARHPERVRVGMIGTGETIANAQDWLRTRARGVRGNEKHPSFVGFQGDRGFFSELDFAPSWIQTLTQSEIKGLVRTRTSEKDRLEAAVDLIDSKLRLLADLDLPPEYVVLALPEEVVRRCRKADYFDKEQGRVHRDLRRAIKARAMEHRLPTQILRDGTVRGDDNDTHPAKVAWNFFTGLYFKRGGVPWAPFGLEPGTCYIGVSFYRPLGSKFPAMQTSLVQAFDEHGDGLVLRGHDFDWDPTRQGSRAPHLSGEQAEALVTLALDRYQQEMGQQPARVVVHKRSRYWPGERAGFDDVLSRRVRRYNLLALEPQSRARLLNASSYPPLRCTRFIVGETDYLYTTGFIAALNEFHAMHVPSPLQIADHVGQDTSREVLLSEVLALSKMNWNSANFGGLLPITLRFSELVSEILREMPSDRQPRPQFKFYT